MSACQAAPSFASPELRAIPTASRLRALVAYASRFGNTQRVAEALARGLRSRAGMEVECRPLSEVAVSDLARYDLIAIGGPTEVFSATKTVRSYLDHVPEEVVHGRFGFAFDTRFESRMSGSAGAAIEHRLERLGLLLVRPHASAFVRVMTKEERAAHGEEGAPAWVQKLEHKQPGPVGRSSLDLLEPGSEEKFERLGTEIAANLCRGRGS